MYITTTAANAARMTDESENMRFFGDTMKNYGLKKNVVIEDIQGEERTVFELRRKNAVKNGLKSSAYFDMVTLERVFDNFTMR